MKNIVTKVLNVFHAPQERLLIIDDDASLRTLFSKFFIERGYHVTVAASLSEAKACFEKDEFDLVLHDITLPDGNGVDSLRRIKARRPTLPVIILTSHGYEEERLQTAIENGASAYVSKMLPLDQVLMEVHRCIKASQSLPTKRILTP